MELSDYRILPTFHPRLKYSNALSAIYSEVVRYSLATATYRPAPRTGGSRTAPTKLLDPVGLLIHERSLL
jgi:hypothetical protein